MHETGNMTQICNGLNSVLYGNRLPEHFPQNTRLPQSYPDIDRETTYDLANIFLRYAVDGFSRFGFFRRGVYNGQEDAKFSYLYLPKAKIELLNLYAGHDSIAWKTIAEARRYKSTPKGGPRIKSEFAERAGETVEYLISDPLLYRGNCFGCVQYIFDRDIDDCLAALMSSITDLLNARETQYFRNDEAQVNDSAFFHDLRSPLAIIRLAAYTLGTGSDDYCKSMIKGKIEEIAGLLECRLKLGAIEMGRLRKDETTVNDVVAAFLGKLEQRKRLQKDEFDVEDPVYSDVPAQEIDTAAVVNHCLFNWFNNSWEASRERERKLVVGCKTCYQEDETVIVYKDSIGGMSEKTARAIEEGRSLDEYGKPVTSHELGRGFGIEIVHGIVRNHKGHIKVHPSADKTVFEIYLPVQKAA